MLWTPWDTLPGGPQWAEGRNWLVCAASDEPTILHPGPSAPACPCKYWINGLLCQIDPWLTCVIQVALHQSVQVLYDGLLFHVDPWLTCVIQVTLHQSVQVLYDGLLFHVDPWLTCVIQVTLHQSVQVLYDGLLFHVDPWLTCVIQVTLHQSVQVLYDGLLNCKISLTASSQTHPLHISLTSLLPDSFGLLQTHGHFASYMLKI